MEKITNISSRRKRMSRQRGRNNMRRRDGFARAERILMKGAGDAAKTPACAQIDFNAVNGSTRAARRAGKYDAHITEGTSSTATNNNVLQSHGLTSYRNPRSCGVNAIDRRPPKNTPTTATTTPSRIGSQMR